MIAEGFFLQGFSKFYLFFNDHFLKSFKLVFSQFCILRVFSKIFFKFFSMFAQSIYT